MPKMELLRLADIADMFGVKLETVHRWRMRSESKFPEADYVGPLYLRSTVEKWGRETGRIVDGEIVQRVNRFA